MSTNGLHAWCPHLATDHEMPKERISDISDTNLLTNFGQWCVTRPKMVIKNKKKALFDKSRNKFRCCWSAEV
jgi:hypothetical protein